MTSATSHELLDVDLKRSARAGDEFDEYQVAFQDCSPLGEVTVKCQSSGEKKSLSASVSEVLHRGREVLGLEFDPDVLATKLNGPDALRADAGEG